MIALKKVFCCGSFWFVDERLNEAREVNNPHEFMTLDEFNTLLVIENNLKGVKE